MLLSVLSSQFGAVSSRHTQHRLLNFKHKQTHAHERTNLYPGAVNINALVCFREACCLGWFTLLVFYGNTMHMHADPETFSSLKGHVTTVKKQSRLKLQLV